MTYKPHPYDVIWAKRVLSAVTEGGTLTLPAANLTYRVSHANKILTLLNVEQLFVYESLLTHLKTVAVYAFLDYKVIERSDISAAAMLFEEHMENCPICSDPTDICAVGQHLLNIFYEAVIAEIIAERRDPNDGRKKA